MASIEITGVDELITKLGKVSAMRTLRPAMDKAMFRIQRDMKRYPPKPAGSTYRRGQDPRSEDLGNRWTTRVQQSATGLVGTVGNNASYAPWVQSHQFQARHMTHWQTDADVVEQNRAAIVADFKRVIDEVIK